MCEPSGAPLRTQCGGALSADIFALQRAVWTSDWEPLDRLVLLAIVSYWSADSPEPYPSWDALVQRTNLSRATIARRLQSLTKLGVIRITTKPPRKGAQPTNHYDLTALITAAQPSHGETSLNLIPVSQRDQSQPDTRLTVSKDGSQSETQTRLSLRPEVSIDQSIEGSKSPKPPTGARSKKSSSGETDGRVAPTIAAYSATFEREFHRKPANPKFERAAKAVKSLPPHVTVEDLERAVVIQLTERRHHRFEKKRDAIDLHEIVGMVDLILEWPKRKVPQARSPRMGEQGWRRQPDAGGIDFDQYALKLEGSDG